MYMQMQKKEEGEALVKQQENRQTNPFSPFSSPQNIHHKGPERFRDIRQFFGHSSAFQTGENTEEIQEREAEENQTGIPDAMKKQAEAVSGYSLNDVRVHYHSDKPAQLQALAYTYGSQVYIAPGQEEHLGHEIGHVIQQKRGIVKPTAVFQNIPVNEDESLEREADQMASFVVSETPSASQADSSQDTGSVIQKFSMPDGNTEKDAHRLIAGIEKDVTGILSRYTMYSEENLYVLMPIVVPDFNVLGLAKHHESIDGSIYGFIFEEILGNSRKRKTAEEIDVRKNNYTNYLRNTLERIDKGARELIEDIQYWKAEILENPNAFTNITGMPAGTTIVELKIQGIKLSGSDLHDRGLGVAFVSFLPITEKHFFKRDTTLKPFEVIIKPDQRLIEESLFSDSPESLASQFNEYTWLLDDQDVSGEGQIETIPMKTSSSYRPEMKKEHGTIIKKIVGTQIDALERGTAVADHKISAVKAIIFACFAGIADLHRENVLYKEGRLYFIDADMAADTRFLLNAETTQQQEGLSGIVPQLQLEDFTTEILMDIKNAFRGKFGRLIPISTEGLQNDRQEFILKNEQDRQELLNQHISQLYEALNDTLAPVSTNVGAEKEETYRDYSQGQLPFYIYLYDSGNVKHGNSFIAKGKDLLDLIEEAYHIWMRQRG